jgi:hypothetical protein
MKTVLAALAAVAVLAVSGPVQAAGWTDDPTVPNCSILDQSPGCEWVATPVGKSIDTSGNGHPSCGGDAVWTNQGGYWHCVCV